MKIIKIATLLFFLQLQLTGQHTRKLSGDSLVRDYNILKTSLIENHPLFLQYITLKDFNSFSLEIEKQIAVGQTLTQFHASLSQLLRVMGCGHTYVYPSSFATKRLQYTNDLPFTISVIRDSLYIHNVYDSLHQKYVGAHIQSMNKTKSIDFIKFVYSVSSSDGYNLRYKKYALQNKFTYYLNENLTYPDSIVFATNKGDFKINFPTKFIRQASEEPLPFFRSFDGDSNAVLLSIPNFDEGKATIKDCFKYCEKNKTKNLILDLRNNGGGNGNIGSLLLSYFIDTTYTYYLDKKTSTLKYKDYFKGTQGLIISNQFVMKDSITKSYYFKVKPQKKNAFKGKVYVLINSGTFSSAAFVASVLKYKSKAIFIGEETGGSEYAIGGGVISELMLPYSKLSVKFPLYKWSFNTSTKGGHGVLPDIKVEYKIKDLLNNRNLEIEKTLELIHEK